MKKTFLSWLQVEKLTQDVIRQITLSEWRPDYIIGITRGGLIPATLISQYFNLPMYTLKVSLRDNADTESNCWMAEDAFGYVDVDNRDSDAPAWDPSLRKNILIVDDINDTGATFNWIKKDWQSSCFVNDPIWQEIWDGNVRLACLYDNETSESQIPVRYSAVAINKHENPQWIVYPWENFWKNEI